MKFTNWKLAVINERCICKCKSRKEGSQERLSVVRADIYLVDKNYFDLGSSICSLLMK